MVVHLLVTVKIMKCRPIGTYCCFYSKYEGGKNVTNSVTKGTKDHVFFFFFCFFFPSEITGMFWI